MTRALVELCCGTASVSLWALGRGAPLCGFMGSKRRWASLLVETLGCDGPDRVVLVDAGPWADVWTVLRTPTARREVAQILRSWDSEDLAHLWARLAETPPALDLPALRVAQLLWLQARSAGTIPVWWSAEHGRWESPTGSRTEAAHTRGGGALARRHKGRASRQPGPPAQAEGLELRRAERGEPSKGYGCRGIQRPSTIARRIEALERLPWERVEVIHGDVRDVEPIPGSVTLIDPPYVGCPRYAALLPRADVVAVARRHDETGARVAVCEAEPVAELGWYARRLPSTRKPEWLTTSWPVALPEQLDLWEVA